MEISSWNSFSDLRLLTSIILTTDLNFNRYSYYLDGILLPFIYADFFSSIVQYSFKSVILIDIQSLPSGCREKIITYSKGPSRKHLLLWLVLEKYFQQHPPTIYLFDIYHAFYTYIIPDLNVTFLSLHYEFFMIGLCLYLGNILCSVSPIKPGTFLTCFLNSWRKWLAQKRA